MIGIVRSAALLCVAAVAAINVAHLARETPPVWNLSGQPSDPASIQERRLSRVREGIAIRGIGGKVGYISDTDTTEDRYLAQYALLPLVLTGDVAQVTWCVAANVRLEAPGDRIPAGSWRLIEDYGDGIRLYRRAER